MIQFYICHAIVVHGNKIVSTYDNEKTAINTTRPTFANYSQCC